MKGPGTDPLCIFTRIDAVYGFERQRERHGIVVARPGRHVPYLRFRIFPDQRLRIADPVRIDELRESLAGTGAHRLRQAVPLHSEAAGEGVLGEIG